MESFLRNLTLGGGGIFALIFTLVLGNIIYRMLRHGGFKGGLYGATIDRELGTVKGESKGLVTLSLNVHRLSRPGHAGLVGLETVAKSVASYKSLPVALTREDARRLASMLQRAAEG